jgi:hypothetical protein
VNFPGAPRDLLGRVRWGFLLALLVCIATTLAQTIAATGVPPTWRAIGVLLVLGLAAGSVLGHRRGRFGRSSIELSTYLVPSFKWDLFEVLLQIPAVLLVGVIHILGVTNGRHERGDPRHWRGQRNADCRGQWSVRRSKTINSSCTTSPLSGSAPDSWRV